MEKRVCIINFNTGELVRAAILSLLKHTPDAEVAVFDNSDKSPCFSMGGVSVIDNTEGQIIDFQKFLSRFPNKRHTTNNWGSAKHARTVEELMNLFPEGFVLMDSDVLVKQDISSLFDNNCVAVGREAIDVVNNTKLRSRIQPYLCWINSRLCLEHRIHYFDATRSWKLYPGHYDTWYDTGASFLEDCKKSGLPIRQIEIEDYIIHLYGGSYKDKDWKGWLEQYRYLYETK